MLQEAEFAMTDNAMSDQSNRFRKDENLFVKFHIKPLQSKGKSVIEGRPIFEDQEYVSIMVPGNKTSIVDRPARQTDRDRFPKHYAAFKANEGDLLEGTPLEQWPQISRSQVEELRYFNVRTVEQVAQMADAQAQQFMGINTLRTAARLFIDAAKENADLSKYVADMEEKDNQIAVLTQAVEALKDKVDSIDKEA